MGVGENVHSSEGQGASENRPASITLGIVKSNYDILHSGMVKVNIKGPDGKDIESEWMPVASPYAGNKSGFYALPDVGATVLIGYVDDNPASPMVIGSVWSTQGVSKSSLPTNAANSKNTTKVFVSSKGNTIKFDESSESPCVEIISAKKQSIKFDDKSGSIKITSKSGDSQIELDGKSGKISISAKDTVSFKVGGKSVMELKKTGVEIKSDSIKLEGKQLKMKGNQAKLEGSQVNIKAEGNLSVESSTMAQIKGTMLKLN